LKFRDQLGRQSEILFHIRSPRYVVRYIYTDDPVVIQVGDTRGIQIAGDNLSARIIALPVFDEPLSESARNGTIATRADFDIK